MAERHISEGTEYTFAVKSDVGLVRDNNEDAFVSSALSDEGLLIAVCDGMGGHDAGEVASGLAVRIIEEEVAGHLDDAPQQRLYGSLLEANRVICEEGAGETGDSKGMGTTAIVTIVNADKAYIGQVGDSRLYQIRAGGIVYKTRDHTRVQQLLEAGEIDAYEARTHPESGMLTRALGHGKMSNGDDLVPEVQAEPLTLYPGDCLLLCSDGLTDLVDDEEIAEQVCGRAPDEIIDIFIGMAKDRGAHDNITVAVLIYGEVASAFEAVAVDSLASLPPEETFEQEFSEEEQTEDVLIAAIPEAVVNLDATDAIAVDAIRVSIADERLDPSEEAIETSSKTKMVIFVVAGLVLLSVIFFFILAIALWLIAA